ncbi:hypothetical protein [Caldalkalibacillus salinus]|uniref:hypothetical protein n=1 Tax=Caldalkalibacillus salinus TaxID=2803787 RepID=UPI0019231A71|nr:hypothetical protein [Caldalkalibacillus salinus]
MRKNSFMTAFMAICGIMLFVMQMMRRKEEPQGYHRMKNGMRQTMNNMLRGTNDVLDNTTQMMSAMRKKAR